MGPPRQWAKGVVEEQAFHKPVGGKGQSRSTIPFPPSPLLLAAAASARRPYQAVAQQRDPPFGEAANQALKGFTAMMPQYICPSFRFSVRMLSQPIRSAAATICAS